MFWRITFPLLIPGILAAALLCFALSFDDFIITNFDRGSAETFPKFVYIAAARGIPPQANVIASLVFLLAIVIVVATQLLGGASTSPSRPNAADRSDVPGSRSPRRASARDETERFSAEHPRSESCGGGAREHHARRRADALDGEMAGPVAVFVDEAKGAHFSCADGLDHVDLCLGDTGAMVGHAPGRQP